MVGAELVNGVGVAGEVRMVLGVMEEASVGGFEWRPTGPDLFTFKHCPPIPPWGESAVRGAGAETGRLVQMLLL